MKPFEDNLAPSGKLWGIESAGSGAKKRTRKSEGSSGSQSTTVFSFTVTTAAAQEASEEDKLDFDWGLLREWAGVELSATSQARMLFEAEKKNRMSVAEAVPKFVVIRRLLEDELKRRAI